MEIGILTAFVGGIISFLSPCVLPLVPVGASRVAIDFLCVHADATTPAGSVGASVATSPHDDGLP